MKIEVMVIANLRVGVGCGVKTFSLSVRNAVGERVLFVVPDALRKHREERGRVEE